MQENIVGKGHLNAFILNKYHGLFMPFFFMRMGTCSYIVFDLAIQYLFVVNGYLRSLKTNRIIAMFQANFSFQN